MKDTPIIIHAADAGTDNLLTSQAIKLSYDTSCLGWTFLKTLRAEFDSECEGKKFVEASHAKTIEYDEQLNKQIDDSTLYIIRLRVK